MTKKLLVIQQKMIGDVLVSSMLFEHLKSRFPEAEMHYLINAHTTAVVTNNPFIDKIVVFKPEYRENKWSLLKFLNSIQREGYDTVIDVYGKLESGLITLFSGAKVKISYQKWYSKVIYTHLLPLRPRVAGKTGITVEDRLGLLSPLVSAPLDLKIQPKIFLTPQEKEFSFLFLKERGIDTSKPIIMLNILGSSDIKTYPLPYMATIIDYISENYPSTLLFNYIPSQKKTAEKLYDLCGEKNKGRIKFDVFAPSLRDFVGLLFHCSALIGNEGGAVNMAKALSLPTFSIYSPLINKMAWHTFPGEQNAAVHVKDYFPESVKNKSKKELKARISELYEKFKPKLFIGKLTDFLDNHILTDN